MTIAWEAFGEKNGAASYQALRDQILRYRSPEPNPEIGCIVLAQPFFFEKRDWIPQPADWSPNLVSGRSYDTQDPIGASLWNQVQERLERLSLPLADDEQTIPLVAEPSAQYGSEYLMRPRLGQGAFRALVTDAYKRRCAVTGQRTLPVLHAAHIKPYAQSGPHDVRNGLLLRADIHILFERGYMTITKDLDIEVSRRIREEFENGEEYYALHGNRLAVMPSRRIERPAAEYVEWHNEIVFRA